MTNYIVYAVLSNRSEHVAGRFEFEDQAIAFITRYLNQHPTATCYINDGTVGWVK